MLPCFVLCSLLTIIVNNKLKNKGATDYLPFKSRFGYINGEQNGCVILKLCVRNSNTLQLGGGVPSPYPRIFPWRGSPQFTHPVPLPRRPTL